MKVKFVPQNIEVEVTPEKTLLQIAGENNIEIKSVCKGVPSCAECRVHIKSGEHNVIPPSKTELSLIGTSYYIDGRRLSCQVRCFGDVTVDVSEQLQRAESQSKKVRGFRAAKQVESRAIQDTMILNEKIEDSKGQQQPSANASDGGPGAPQNQQHSGGKRQGGGQQQGQQKQRNSGHKHHHNNNNKNQKQNSQKSGKNNKT